MDKEHLKEGNDSRQSGYQEIRQVAACKLLLKRNHVSDTCLWYLQKEWLLKIECLLHYKEISRIFDEMTFPAYVKSQVCANMYSDQRLELISF